VAKFYGIGVGPGDLDLLTIKATKVLGLLDAVMIPSTIKGKMGVAETIISHYLNSTTEKIYIDFPMVADETVFIQAGIEAAKLIETYTQQGKNIGFVTLGDASVYSTYGYIVKALAKSVEIETIPGITSFCAAAALANRPLVEKDEILTILPMNASDERIDEAIAASDACVFMKIYKREDRVLGHLKKYKMEEDGILAQRCGFKDAQIHQDVEEKLRNNTDYLTLVLSRKDK
jgi:precorrin-2/cobalt-factor-2 C20-methyltransferase